MPVDDQRSRSRRPRRRRAPSSVTLGASSVRSRASAYAQPLATPAGDAVRARDAVGGVARHESRSSARTRSLRRRAVAGYEQRIATASRAHVARSRRAARCTCTNVAKRRRRRVRRSTRAGEEAALARSPARACRRASRASRPPGTSSTTPPSVSGAREPRLRSAAGARVRSAARPPGRMPFAFGAAVTRSRRRAGRAAGRARRARRALAIGSGSASTPRVEERPSRAVPSAVGSSCSARSIASNAMYSRRTRARARDDAAASRAGQRVQRELRQALEQRTGRGRRRPGSAGRPRSSAEPIAPTRPAVAEAARERGPRLRGSDRRGARAAPRSRSGSRCRRRSGSRCGSARPTARDQSCVADARSSGRGRRARPASLGSISWS